MLPPCLRIWLASKAVDMRRGHVGSMAVVGNGWELEPFSPHLFAFAGRRVDRIEVLVWSRGGLERAPPGHE